MKITIAGYGFVGKAYYELLKEKYDVTVVDPAYVEYNNPIPHDTDAIIVCVSTPANDDGSCHMDNVYSVIEQSPNVPILIKSTISLEGWNLLIEKFKDYNISFSPEFLRANTAVEDLLAAEEMLIAEDADLFWSTVFMNNDRKLIVRIYKPEELILAKVLRNSFLALKVSFFNQAYDLCNKLDVDFSEVREAVTLDQRIGNSHSYVTEERGYGGHCFPKDVKALISTGKEFGVDLSLLIKAHEYNENFNHRT